MPVYTFHIVSIQPDGTPAGSPFIEVFQEGKTSEPLQKLQLNPNSFMADSLPKTFHAADINFDGFTDIGVIVDGGATWAAYQYWMFDPMTGKFITTRETDELRNIGSQGLSFDKGKKQIIGPSLLGTGATLKVYQFENGDLNILKDYLQENILIQDGKEKTAHPTLECHLTLKDYDGEIYRKRTEVVPHECSPKDFGIL